MGERSQLSNLNPVADRVGKSICGWTVERLLGVGPICETWFAVEGRPRSVPRRSADPAPRVVLRILRDPFAVDDRSRSDWLGASWATNRFSHPRVPRLVKDGVDADGAPVVVRAWAQGRSLEEVVRAGVLGVEPALRLAEQILDALEMAHAHRVVHGALKPSNVIVSDRGTARLVDFAVVPGRGDPPRDLLRRARVSRYTAPEPTEPTEAGDVWSVGACLYFALTGEAPSGPSPTLRAIRGRAPRHGQALVAVVGRALAADPGERYGSAYAMLGDVRRVLAGRAPRLEASVTPVSSQRTALAERASSGRPAPVRRTQRVVPARPPVLERPPASEVSGAYPLAVEPFARRRVPGAAGAEWPRNVLLFLAIAVIAAVAAYVVARERLTDPLEPPALSTPAT